MYRRNVKKQTLITICIASVLSVFGRPLSAREEAIVLGRGDGWGDVTRLENLVLVPGRWGHLDIVLADNAYRETGELDLLLHFDGKPFSDASGFYRVGQDASLLSSRITARGAGSAGFEATRGGLLLSPGPGALFGPASWPGDFSIEFWLYPLVLEEGEEIFWCRGSRWREGETLDQLVSARVQGQKLSWRFENFFLPSSGEPFLLVLEGLEPLIPKRWSHHLLRYQRASGLLEYLVDGVPEAVTYATASGAEEGDLLAPHLEAAGPAALQIGKRFTGFVDEIRVARLFEEEPRLSRYGNRTGRAVSRVFDLGYSGTEVRRIASVFEQPQDSEVYFFYRLADRLDAAGEPASGWVQFRPESSLAEARGRYIQVMLELFPNGGRDQTPEVSELRIVYEQDLPPAPPAALRAEAGDGKVILSWQPVNERDVRGYRVYYGEAPGNYLGRGCAQGDSPLDVGNVTRFEVGGLENGKLYTFTVAAYDAADPPHLSRFSREVSARPSALFAGEGPP
jgi:hypothetical protein